MGESLQKRSRRLSWISKYGSLSRENSTLPTPQEGKELFLCKTPSNVTTQSTTANSDNDLIFFTRTESKVSPRARPSSASKASRPTTPIFSTKRWSTSTILTPSFFGSPPQSPIQQQDQQSYLSNDLQRTISAQSGATTITTNTSKAPELSKGGSFGKMALNSVMGGLSALSLTRASTNDDSRGRAECKQKYRSNSVTSTKDRDAERSRSRARSQSPFSLRRFRSRDNSPAPLPLEESDYESGRRTLSIRPRTAFTDDPDSGSEFYGDDTEDDDEEWSDGGLDMCDPVTERNTEQNALIVPVEDGLLMGDMDAEVDADPLGEGVNVVVPPEPYFPTTLNRTSSGHASRKKSGPKRRKSRNHETLPHTTSRPVFKRDRCTINITQGNPDAIDGKKRSFIVASDMSEESRYAVEWGIGTVLRDGDEMLIVTVVENESKVDPDIPNATDRALKVRSQQERQGMAYILVRQAMGLLQRTRLNVVISCQAWHAKNARHMLLDIVDYNEPTMLIVGSRGLNQIKGILLGSTSHYLIEKCSVPVMVARRRLRRPPRRSAHLTKNRVHVSLAEAGIDRVAPKVDQDVAVMRDEIQRDEARRDGAGGRRDDHDRGGIEEEEEGEEEGDPDDAEASMLSDHKFP